MNEKLFPKRLSRSAEDYLEAVGELCKKNGQAQVSELAAMLGVKKPSVTVAMRNLSQLGMVHYEPYCPIQLTEKGRRYADSVMNAHHVLMEFMKKAAGLEAERAEKVACLIEHILTMDEVAGIEAKLSGGFFEQIPSGSVSERQ